MVRLSWLAWFPRLRGVDQIETWQPSRDRSGHRITPHLWPERVGSTRQPAPPPRITIELSRRGPRRARERSARTSCYPALGRLLERQSFCFKRSPKLRNRTGPHAVQGQDPSLCVLGKFGRRRDPVAFQGPPGRRGQAGKESRLRVPGCLAFGARWAIRTLVVLMPVWARSKRSLVALHLNSFPWKREVQDNY